VTSIPISSQKVSLTDIVRRVEAGEDVVLTRGGRPVARIDAVVLGGLAERRGRAIEAAWSQDFLYDEDGLPA